MNIELQTEDSKIFIQLDGRLDTTSTPELEQRLGGRFLKTLTL